MCKCGKCVEINVEMWDIHVCGDKCVNVMPHVKIRLMSAFVICQKSIENYFNGKYNFLCKLIFWYQIIPKSVIFKNKTNFTVQLFKKN